MSPTLDPNDIEDVYPATPFQQGVLHTAAKSHPPGRFFLAVYHLFLPPHTDLDRLRTAWKVMENSHSILRTGYCISTASLSEELPLSNVLSLVFKPGKGPQGGWHQFVRDDLEQTRMQALGQEFVGQLSFDPYSGKPPFAVHVVGCPRVGYHLRLCWHSALGDGGTVLTWVKSLHGLYHRRIMGNTLPKTTFAPVAGTIVKDGISNEKNGAAEVARQHWRQLLQDLPDASWPSVPPRPSSKDGGHVSQPLSAITLVRHCAAPPSSQPNRPAFRSRLVRAALALAMCLHSGLDDHIFGETRNSRALLPSHLRSMAGPCLYAQIVRLQCCPGTKLEDLMHDAGVGNKDKADQIMTKAPMTLGQILAAVGRVAAEKLRVFLVVYAKPFWLGDEDMPGWQFMDHWTYHDTPLDVSVLVPRSGAVQVRVRYNSAISQTVDVPSFVDHFVAILGLLSSSNEFRTAQDVFRALGEIEGPQTLRFGRGLSHDQQQPQPDLSQPLVHELVETCTRSTPSAIALEFERSSTMSYSELDARSTALAAELRDKKGVRPDMMVPILFDVSFEMIVAILAVMKAGGAYVPLGLDHPKDRLKRVLDIAGPRLLLCGQGTASVRASELKDIFPNLDLLVYAVGDSKTFAAPTQSNRLLPGSVTAEHLAYVLFTSGTTGMPKGVGVEHRNLSAFLRSGKGDAMAPAGMRKLLLSPYTFDISVGDIFSTLTSGGTLGLVRRQELLSNLPYWLDMMKTTHLAVTPSVGRQIPTEGLPHLTHIIFVGETLPVDLAIRLSQTRQVHNTMGPTECVIDATEYVVPKSTDASDAAYAIGDRVPIGYPIGATNIYVLRPSTLELTARGEVGEICIGGPQVSRGYVTDAELSRSKFVSDPFTGVTGGMMFRSGDMGRWNQFGQLEHLGRMDGQVKLRGLRIETGEIEHVVRKSSPDIHTVYADVLDMTGEQTLVVVFTLSPAAIVPSMYKDLDENAQIRGARVISASEEMVARILRLADEACTTHLPPYMRPSLWLSLDDFPKNAHGKLDRQNLRSLIQEHASSCARTSSITINRTLRKASTEAELTVAAVLAQELGRPAEDIDMDSTFLSLGGSSLQAMRVTSALQARGIGAHVSDCLDDGKTVAMLAALPRIKARGGAATGIEEENGYHQRSKSDEYARFSLAPDGWQDGLRAAGVSVDDVEDVYPCTSAAQMWVDLALRNQGRSLLCQFHHSLGQDIDAPHFSWCWEQLRLREPCLRTVFVEAGDKATVTPVVLRPEAHPKGGVLDTICVADGNELVSLIQKLFAEHRLELGKVPIQSWLIFNEGDGKWSFASSRHHALHDARTLDAQGIDLNELYFNGESALTNIERKRTLESSFGAYMYSYRSEQPHQRAFWRRYLHQAGPSIWPPPSKVPITFCKDLSLFKFHVTEWHGSLQELAKVAGVTKAAIVRGTYALAMSEKEGRSDTIVYETVEGRTGAAVNTWGFCTHFDLTRIQVPLPLPPRHDTNPESANEDLERSRFLQVVREANRSFAKTLPNISMAWDMANEIFRTEVEPNCKFQTSILNILDMSGGDLRKDKLDDVEIKTELGLDVAKRAAVVIGNGYEKVPSKGKEDDNGLGNKAVDGLVQQSDPSRLFTNSLIQASIIGTYLPLCIEVQIKKDKVVFTCPYDPTIVEKKEIENFVQRQIDVLESLNGSRKD